MISPRSFLLSLSALIFLAACSPESSDFISVEPWEAPPETPIPQYDPIPEQQFNWITEDGGQSHTFNPQVDILFVTDNSESMKSAQENLSRNIDRFTAKLMSNQMIDYHIGVVSAWDNSDRYAQMKKDSYKIGDLRFVKTSAGKTVNKRFISKSEKAHLASTLKIGIIPYNQGGPEIEELFSPLAAALENTGRGAINEGFFRPEAQLVVIFLTDADDSTSKISPEQMARILVDFKGGRAEKVAAYGVLVRPEDPDNIKDYDLRIHPKYHPECFDGNKNNRKCSGFGPQRVEELIVAANSGSGTPEEIRSKYIMSIASKSFGTDLAKMGDDITVKTLAKEIFLTYRPRVDSKTGQLMIRVRYGSSEQLAAGKGQLIPQGSKGGWLYNPEANSVHLSGDINYQYQEGARFAVDLIPLTIGSSSK